MLKDHSADAPREFILFPELFDIGFRHSDYAELGAGVPGPTSDFLTSIAEEYSAYTVGTGIERAGDKWFNTLVMCAPNGKELAKYRKLHPFQEERDIFAGGDKVVLANAGGIVVGLQICYDIRFPEVARRQALEGAELLLIPAAFPDPRSQHWDTLVMARAIENQVYVAAANRIDYSFDGKTYFGHSQFVDPWGLRLTRLNSEPRVITNRGDTDMIKAVRKQITCFADRVEQYYEKTKIFEEQLVQRKH
jgi:omega-amidase